MEAKINKGKIVQLVIPLVDSTMVDREAFMCVIVEKITHPKTALSYCVVYKDRIIKRFSQRYLLIKVPNTIPRIIGFQET